MDRFDIDLARHVAGAFQGDLALSPTSVRLALAMTGGGARGETEAELARLLHADDGLDVLHPLLGQQIASWSVEDAGGNRVVVANRVYAQVGAPFEEDYLALTRDSYGAEADEADFASGFEVERQRINGWVSDTTQQRIPELLPVGALDELTRMVLVNALAFSGKWAVPFDPEQTRDATWRGPGGGQARLMMSQREVPYVHAEGLQLIDLDYAGGELSMVVALPIDTGDLSPAQALLKPGALDAMLEQARPTQVVVGLPRFTARSPSLDLVPVLQEMGVHTLFHPGTADLGRMSPEPHLAVTGVFHQAVVKVDEAGTEGAAATGVVVGLRSLDAPPSFRADHPFMFFIRDRSTGAVLFTGRVVSAPGEGG